MTQRAFRLIMAVSCVVFGIVGAAFFEPPRPAHADTGSNWTGSYFANRDLQGIPVFIRIDPALIFNWGLNSPGPGIGSSNWSARWTTIQYLNAGTYRFTITADDGVRAYIDGQIILDAWRDQAATTYYVNVQVVAGTHAIQVDYYQGGGNASLSVFWDYIVAQSTAWLAQYYNNTSLAGAPVLTRYENSINYFWGTGSPDPVVTRDNFSARWTATLPFSAATYRFTLAGDDGVRLYIDNATVIDQWRLQGVTAYSIDVPLAAGLHTLRVEYFEGTDQAIVRFDYAVAIGPPPYPGTQSDQWYAEYFPNPSLQGSPSFIRLEGLSGINYNWSQNSPAPGFPQQNFSVRWTRRVYFPGRPYVFYLTVDDGARLYIDTTLILDEWRVQGVSSYRKVVDLTEGYHVLRLEYFNNLYQSVINMTWDPPNGQAPPMPPGGPPQPPPPSTGVTATVTNASFLNIRAGPGISFEILSVASRGNRFAVTGRNPDNSWLRIIFGNNATGWVSAFYTTVSGNLNSLPVVSVVPGPPRLTGVRGKLFSGLRLRAGPGTYFPQIGDLEWGAVVDIVGRNASNTWLQVQFGGVTGWIYAPYVRIVAGSLFNVPITG
jgi:uncharacterized protein YraI